MDHSNTSMQTWTVLQSEHMKLRGKYDERNKGEIVGEQSRERFIALCMYDYYIKYFTGKIKIT